jgi:hypothetical protein
MQTGQTGFGIPEDGVARNWDLAVRSNIPVDLQAHNVAAVHIDWDLDAAVGAEVEQNAALLSMIFDVDEGSAVARSPLTARFVLTAQHRRTLRSPLQPLLPVVAVFGMTVVVFLRGSGAGSGNSPIVPPTCFSRTPY